MSAIGVASIRCVHMNPHHPLARVSLALSAVALAAVWSVGCAEPVTPAPTVARAPDIGRDNAVNAAAYDAQTRFGIQNVTPLFVNRRGEVWIVEMSGDDGATLHYAIGAFDGSVRERHVKR